MDVIKISLWKSKTFSFSNYLRGNNVPFSCPMERFFLIEILIRFSGQPTNACLILLELKWDTACPEMFAVIGNGKSEEGTLKVCFVNQSQF